MSTTYILGGQPITNSNFVTTKQRVDSDQEAAWSGLSIGAFADVEVAHRLSDLAGLTDDQLARWQITRSVVADPSAPPAVPATVSRMQARVWMAAQPAATTGGVTGSTCLLDDVDAWVKTQSRSTQEYWANVSDIHRDHALVSAAAAHFAWSSAYVDQMFTEAATVA